MSADEEMTKTTAANSAAATKADTTNDDNEEAVVSRAEKILLAKELYSQGSRNFLVKSYMEAADQLSEVCALYEELYGELSDELGMPYLLYAKSLIALAVDENKLLDVPDEINDDDEDDEEDDDDDKTEEKKPETSAVSSSTSSVKLNGVEKETSNKGDSTADGDCDVNKKSTVEESGTSTTEKAEEQNSSSNDNTAVKNGNGEVATKPEKATVTPALDDEKPSVEVATNKPAKASVKPVLDNEKPSTSNGDTDAVDGEDEEENEAFSNLQLAWEILELAAKIFSRQGLSGFANLAEVQTELANIEFENNIMDAAREDYQKALKIYQELPKNYHRAMAEIHYKIGLTFLMQQLNKEGAASLKEACDLIEAEIADIKSKDELSEKDKNNIQDMEETKQEIRAKIDEIEETQAQNIAEVRAALDSYIKPIVSQNAEGAGTSSSSSLSSSSATTKAADVGTSSSITSKPKDISHLIKRKKPEEPSTETEVNASPAKRPAV